MKTLVALLAAIGGLVILRAAYRIFQFFALHVLTPSRPLASYKRPGEPTWAIVTGASAGIGLGIAQALVRQGFGVILLGHLRDELETSAASLRVLRANARVRTVILDVRSAAKEDIHQLVKSIAPLNVTILVNNVGGNPIAFPAFRNFATYSQDDVDAVTDMNARFMARLTSELLPVLARPPPGKERSLILNLSSGAIYGTPWLVMYSATKAFNRSFSISLSRELQHSPGTKHIDCLAIVPGDVASQGNSQGVPTRAPRWDEYGETIVRKVDGAIRAGLREISPHWQHHLEWFIIETMPERIRTKALVHTMEKKRDAFNAVYRKDC